jgi:hypothetical protein
MMWLHSWLGRLPSAFAGRRTRPLPSRTSRRRALAHRLSVELLEDRSLLSIAPLPFSGGFANPTGGPFLHFYFPGPADAPPIHGSEPSSIEDFHGTIGVAEIHGTGTGTDSSGASTRLFFAADIRFMKGVYQGVDGALHTATFAFV